MEREKTVSEAVHGDQACPTLIKVIDAFTAGGHAVLILPLLAKSAADVLAMLPAGLGLGDEATAYICVGVLAAIAGLASKGWCHADIKPENIMLASHKKLAILVDLGPCTRFTETICECTEGHGLGLPKIAGLQWDLACLASTLCLLAGHAMPHSVYTLREDAVRFHDKVPLGYQLALDVVGHLDDVDTVAKLKEFVWEDVMMRVRDSLGEESAVAMAALWPAPL